MTNCAYDSGNNSGWYTISSKPSTVVKAASGWSFGGSTTRDTITIGGDTAVPCTKSASPSYMSITVTSTNSTIKVGGTSRDSGWSGLVTPGTVITYTGNSGTNYLYSRSASNYSETSWTQTVAAGTTSYSSGEPYLYYNVTINTSYNTTVSHSSGYLCNGTVVVYTANDNTDDTRYSFSSTDNTVHTMSVTVSSAGQTISPGTVYSYYYVTPIAESHCSTTYGPGFYKRESKIYFNTDSTPEGSGIRYSFNASGSSSTEKVQTVYAPGNLSSGTVYTYYYVTVNAQAHSSTSTETGYYRADSTRSVYWVADDTYTFNSDNTENSYATTTMIVDQPNKIITGPDVYVRFYQLLFGTADKEGRWSTYLFKVPKGTVLTHSPYGTITVGDYGSTTFSVDDSPEPKDYQYGFSIYYYDTATQSQKYFPQTSITWPGGSIEGRVGKSYRYYTIHWLNSDYSTDKETDPTVMYGAVLRYNQTYTPTKAADDAGTYTFSKWRLGSTSGSEVVSGTTTNPGSLETTDLYIYPTYSITYKQYAVNMRSTSGCKSAYLSTSSTATSGSESGTKFNYGSTVYMFVTLNDDTTQYTYEPQSTWTHITGRTYRVASLTVGTSNYFDSVEAITTHVACIVTWGWVNSNGNWQYEEEVYAVGATPSRASPDTVMKSSSERWVFTG